MQSQKQTHQASIVDGALNHMLPSSTNCAEYCFEIHVYVTEPEYICHQMTAVCPAFTARVGFMHSDFNYDKCYKQSHNAHHAKLKSHQGTFVLSGDWHHSVDPLLPVPSFPAFTTFILEFTTHGAKPLETAPRRKFHLWVTWNVI